MSSELRQFRQKIVTHHSLGREEIVAGSRQTWPSARWAATRRSSGGHPGSVV